MQHGSIHNSMIIQIFDSIYILQVNESLISYSMLWGMIIDIIFKQKLRPKKIHNHMHYSLSVNRILNVHRIKILIFNLDYLFLVQKNMNQGVLTIN